MNFDKLFTWIAGIVIAAALAGNLEKLQTWIWHAQAETIRASRTSNWGSPRFFTKSVVPSQNEQFHKALPIFKSTNIDSH